jgi:hypothetical protein
MSVAGSERGIFETKVLEDLMRLFNSEEIKQATGDVFGRIYEYFLAKFSIQKAHDNGEFFTPSSIVQTIVNVIEPATGRCSIRPAAWAVCSRSPATSLSTRAQTRRGRSAFMARRRTATPSASPK